MKRITWALALIACAACTTTTASSPTECSQRESGSYVVKYTVRSGNCGDGAETVQNMSGPEPTTVDPPCTGSISYSADNCEVTYSTKCPNNGVVKGGTLAISGKSKWSGDGASGTAVEAWSVLDANGQTVCQGTYDVTLTRQ